MSHLFWTAFLANAHHGIVSRRSSLATLLLTEQGIAQLMNAHESEDVVFRNFSKVCNFVNYRLLCV